jgi:hypothetical protein
MGDKENCADDMLGLPYLAATVATAISARTCWLDLHSLVLARALTLLEFAHKGR